MAFDWKDPVSLFPDLSGLGSSFSYGTALSFCNDKFIIRGLVSDDATYIDSYAINSSNGDDWILGPATRKAYGSDLIFGYKFIWDGTNYVTASTGQSYRSVFKSADLETWTEMSLLPSGGIHSSFWYDFIAHGTLSIAVGNKSVAVSPDSGNTWTGYALPSNQNWNCIASNGTILATPAYGTTTIAYSNDNGETWQTSVLPISAGWSGICWNGTVWCLVADDSNIVLTSSNLTDWVQNTGISSRAIASNSAGVLCIGTATSKLSFDNGVTWDTKSMPSNWNNIDYLGLVSDGIHFVARNNEVSPRKITRTLNTTPLGGFWTNLVNAVQT